MYISVSPTPLTLPYFHNSNTYVQCVYVRSYKHTYTVLTVRTYVCMYVRTYVFIRSLATYSLCVSSV